MIGLLTDVSLSSNQKGSNTGAISSSALAGVDFQVGISPTSGNQGSVVMFPAANQPITYDSRFIQISSNLFRPR